MRKQIGLRMKDETRDQLERVRGGLSRTDYIEGAVLAQIARDLKKTEAPHEYSLDSGSPVDIIEDKRIPPDMATLIPHTVREGELRDGSRIEDGEVYLESERCDCGMVSRGLVSGKCTDCRDKEKDLFSRYFTGWPVRSSAESKAGVLPVPKKPLKGRK